MSWSQSLWLVEFWSRRDRGEESAEHYQTVELKVYTEELGFMFVLHKLCFSSVNISEMFTDSLMSNLLVYEVETAPGLQEFVDEGPIDTM